jgi:hypothetical protein
MKGAVWIVEWEYDNDGDWQPVYGCPPSRTKILAVDAMRRDMEREKESLEHFRYRVRRYVREPRQ